MSRPLFHRLALRLVALAMAFGAVAPTLSLGMARAAGTGTWMEVCTAQGMRWVHLREVAQAPTSQAGSLVPKGLAGWLADHLERCPCCTSALQGMAPPPGHTGFEPCAGLHALVPQRSSGTSKASSGWSAAQPRAPPARA